MAESCVAASVSFAQAFVGAAEAASSEPLLQVQSRVHRRDLFAVAVVHARGDAICEQLAGLAGDAAFGLLAPARVVDVRVDVAEEAVFLDRKSTRLNSSH